MQNTQNLETLLEPVTISPFPPETAVDSMQLPISALIRPTYRAGFARYWLTRPFMTAKGLVVGYEVAGVQGPKGSQVLMLEQMPIAVIVCTQDDSTKIKGFERLSKKEAGVRVWREFEARSLFEPFRVLQAFRRTRRATYLSTYVLNNPENLDDFTLQVFERFGALALEGLSYDAKKARAFATAVAVQSKFVRHWQAEVQGECDLSIGHLLKDMSIIQAQFALATTTVDIFRLTGLLRARMAHLIQRAATVYPYTEQWVPWGKLMTTKH